MTIASEKLESPDHRFLPFVALAANLKLGGQNHSLQTSKLRFLSNKKCMFVGITASDLMERTSKSVARFGVVVTSVDPALSQWPSAFCVQDSDQHTISNLMNLMSSRIKLWAYKNRGEFPEDIVIYRDNVPPSQFDSVAQEELWLIRRGCDSVYPKYLRDQGLPRVTMVLVDQRSRMSFTPIADANAHGTKFPGAGTVVDRGVTDPRVWDFYLLSHCPNIGGNQPTHYHVACDEVFRRRYPGFDGQNTAAAVLQEVTHCLSYLAGEQTMAANVCAPVYYAWAALSRLSGYANPFWGQSGRSETVPNRDAKVLGFQTHRSLQNTMFYI